MSDVPFSPEWVMYHMDLNDVLWAIPIISKVEIFLKAIQSFFI